MKARLGRGAIIVEAPSQRLMDGLRRFVHKSTGGEYENLYTLYGDGKILAAPPGLASRVKSLCDSIVDERLPMPHPEVSSLGCGCWDDVLRKAVFACGGIVSVPDILGVSGMAAGILKAFSREPLMERGTPLSVVATKDSTSARMIAHELSERLPGREVGFTATNRYTDSEDIIVAPYDALYDVQVQYAGVFIGDDPLGGNLTSRAKAVSAIRSAARWGILSTSFGGDVDIGIEAECLFGPLVASASYADAVKAGMGVPISVVWIPGPRPPGYLGSAPEKVLAEAAMQRNDSFVKLLADIMRHVDNDMGCILCVEDLVLAERLRSLLPDVVNLNRTLPKKETAAMLGDIAGGTIRKAIVSSGCFPKRTSHGVMIVANCGGGCMSGWNIPWRHLTRPGEKTWLVDFRHDWDRHNGRPGRLALNDEARMRRYREMGFSQMTVESAAQLPF